MWFRHVVCREELNVIKKGTEAAGGWKTRQGTAKIKTW